jgi:ATP-dependent DNA helicase RecG
VVENVSKRYFEAGFGAEENGTAQEMPKKCPRNAQEMPKKLTEEIVSAITDNPRITRMELAVLLGHTPDRIKHHLKKLTEQGIIKHVGSTKAGEWVIIHDK